MTVYTKILTPSLAKVLDQHGENSLEARRDTQRYRELFFGVQYWRTAPPLVRSAIKAAELQGVSRADLRLLALNQDVRQVGETIIVRRAWWMPVFAYAAPIVVLSNWAYLMTFVLISSGAWYAKIVATLVITLLYWVLWPGFSLYSTRAFAAVKRSGEIVQAVGEKNISPANLHSFTNIGKA
ncbi:MAG: hypothetical protein PHX10_08530 [Gallionellaceae bacterium]|nr:hypothetical protein [Gallionellaceae bacterium]